MPAPKHSQELIFETLKLYESSGKSCAVAARTLNIPRTTFVSRLNIALERYPDGISDAAHPQSRWTYPRMVVVEAPSTRWIVGSDLHVWSGEPTLIFKAFVKVAKMLKVDGIVLNGDIIDGARVSRHPSIRNSSAPKIEKEIETAKAWLSLLPNAKHKLWTLGNHDVRIDTYVAANANELDGYILSLADHFKDWQFSYAFEVNNTEIRHRFRSGIHAAWNNSLHSGVNIVTGHTHQLQVTATRDRNGSRWGVETGMMADPYGPQFEYAEGTPSRSHQGFVVLSFDENGSMLPPELCEMIGGRPIFRGDHIF